MVQEDKKQRLIEIDLLIETFKKDSDRKISNFIVSAEYGMMFQDLAEFTISNENKNDKKPFKIGTYNSIDILVDPNLQFDSKKITMTATFVLTPNLEHIDLQLDKNE